MSEFKLPPNKPEIYENHPLSFKIPSIVDVLDSVPTTKSLSKKFTIIEKRDRKLRWKRRKR